MWIGLDHQHLPSAVDMALNEMTTEPRVQPSRAFEVDFRTDSSAPQRTALESFLHDVGREGVWPDINNREADPVHGDRIPRANISENHGPADRDAFSVREWFHRRDSSPLLDNPGEHE